MREWLLIDTSACILARCICRCYILRCSYLVITIAKICDCNTRAKVQILKELSDVLFTCYQLAAAINFDADEALQRVFESNMSKLGPDGNPIYREDGKVLKGPNYKEPDLIDLVVS